MLGQRNNIGEKFNVNCGILDNVGFYSGYEFGEWIVFSPLLCFRIALSGTTDYTTDCLCHNLHVTKY